ncbi:phosphoribosylglycinamide formyltransferase [Mycobacterium sp. ITM-2017-0098]|nr:phosphoribosylglycinamide formyltransferase [Mycobacterium sp. ITM-2017-0098]
MPHPIMFRDDDTGLADVRRIALGFPEAFEKVSWGRPVFCAPKMFAVYGGSVKSSVTSEFEQHPHSILVKVDDSDRRALDQDRRFFFPAYLGPFGWLGLDLTAAKVDWAEVTELVDASFRMVAAKKLVRQLDER